MRFERRSIVVDWVENRAPDVSLVLEELPEPGSQERAEHRAQEPGDEVRDEGDRNRRPVIRHEDCMNTCVLDCSPYVSESLRIELDALEPKAQDKFPEPAVVHAPITFGVGL